MNLAYATKALLDELIRMRSEGIERVHIDEDTMQKLESAIVPHKKGNFTVTDPTVDLVEEVAITKNEIAAPVDKRVVPGEERPIRTAVQEPTAKLPSPPVIELPSGEKKEKWDWLRKRVLECETCNGELNPNGKVVFGEGDLNADLFLCGEAPGSEEEESGLPFHGPAGDLLVKILSAMGLSRDKVYIANILNWRPKHAHAYGSRPPTQEELGFCLPYLKSQLEIVKPKVIVSLGKITTDALLGHEPKRRLSHVRGMWHKALGLPMMVTYHPSYLLHNPSRSSKRKVWEDFLLIMEKLEMPINEKQKGYFL
jgi:DNA polymerase